MYKTFFSILLVLCVLAGCSKSDRIDEEKFVVIYSKIIIAKNQFGENSPDFVAAKTGILKSANISEKEVKITIDSYSENPEQWVKFLEKVDNYLVGFRK